MRLFKCETGQSKVEFVGPTAGDSEVGIHESNIYNIRKANRPTIKKEV